MWDRRGYTEQVRRGKIRNRPFPLSLSVLSLHGLHQQLHLSSQVSLDPCYLNLDLFVRGIVLKV